MPGPKWQLGFLYAEYREELYSYECVELIRKLLLWYVEAPHTLHVPKASRTQAPLTAPCS